ncbi:MAG: hypothetical protein IJ064_07430 [Bacteroidaceae bacterium]|nr:hypothetical protein [Bacteroidaceae bacterium]
MSEKEILQLQAGHPGRGYLLRVGLFYHAYDASAFALGRLTGYRVVERSRRGYGVAVLGFPSARLASVRGTLAAHGIQLCPADPEGNPQPAADTTPADTSAQPGFLCFESPLLLEAPETPPTPPTPANPKKTEKTEIPATQSPLLRELLAFDLASSTPMDAMNFLNRLRTTYGPQ